MSERSKLSIIGIFCLLLFACMFALAGCSMIRFEMNFSNMRAPTIEENYNNAYSHGEMAANERFVCFVHPDYGLVKYDVLKQKYKVIDGKKSALFGDVMFDCLQIYGDYLYYKKYTPDYVHGIYKIDLNTSESSLVSNQIDGGLSPRIGSVFNVFNGHVVSERQRRIIIDDVALPDIRNEYAFAIKNSKLYCTTMDNRLIVFDLITGEKKELEQNKINREEKEIIALFVYGDSVYVITRLTNQYGTLGAIIRNDMVEDIESELTCANGSGVVFFDNYIVCDSGFYTLDGKFVKPLTETSKKFIANEDGKNQIYYTADRPVLPLIVGGNLYVYSVDKKPLDGTVVGGGWYCMSDIN